MKNIKKVLLFIPPTVTSKRRIDINPMPPLGLGDLAAILEKNGIEAKIVDCLLDARRLIRAEKFDYLLLASLVPARSGGTSSVPNAHRVLWELGQSRNGTKEPVIVLLPPEDGYPEPTKRAAVRMAHGFMRRGAADFVDKPFPTAGRTLDRVIEKVLGIDDSSSAAEDSCDHEGEKTGKSTPMVAAPSSVVPLTKVQLEILEAMAESPLQTMLQSGIVELSGHNKHTARECLHVLVKSGLVVQPHGVRGGYSITQPGRRILERTRGGGRGGAAKI